VSNVVLVGLAPHVAVDIDRLQRHFLSSSACGVCGKTSIEALENAGAEPILNDSFSIGEPAVMQLPAIARKLQGVHEQTGGTHAAAAFDSRAAIVCLREDIGRHNALDKLIGALSHKATGPICELGLWVSGRASFELLQKAAMAGFPFFVAVGAPSSLAVAIAREFEITLLGFVRHDRFTIYNRPDRVRLSG
jgi:FdhD protein